MKPTIDWINSTAKNKSGICEAATTLWLLTIRDQDIKQANKLKPQDCDTLQKDAETGNSVWYRELVGAGGINFDPFNGQKSVLIKENKKPMVANNLSNLLAQLSEGEFCYINADTPNGNKQGDGHALAIYRSQNSIYFFNPNIGIYECEASVEGAKHIANQIQDNVRIWSNVSLNLGEIIQ